MAEPLLSWPSANQELTFEHVDGQVLYNFIIRIVFSSPEHNVPATHQIWIDVNDDGIFEDEEKMNYYFQPQNFPGIDYNGELFTAYANIESTANRTVQYQFYWVDEEGLVATGDPTVSSNYVTLPTFNYQPALSYSAQSGYGATYVQPAAGINEGTFTFRARYKDNGDEAPADAKLYLDVNDDGQYVPSECYTLLPQDPTDNNYIDGKEYYYEKTLSYLNEGTYRYYFSFRDSAFTVTTNEGTVSLIKADNPVIDFVNDAHYAAAGVYPTTGKSGDTFTFKVNYISALNTKPEEARVSIDCNLNGTFDNDEVFDLLESDPADTDMSDGKEYFLPKILTHPGNNIGQQMMYKFNFVLSGYGTVTGNAAATMNLQLDYGQSKKLILKPNYPNPFGRAPRTETHFAYNLESATDVEIDIYDLMGVCVRTMYIPAGSIGATQGRNRTLTWDGRDDNGSYVPNGVYLYVVKADGQKETGKMVFIR